jgi:hypothetical protein
VASGVQTGHLTNPPPTPAPPTPAPVVKCSSWEDLRKGVAACTSVCNFALAKGFTTPSTDFTRIDVGSYDSKDPRVHISIDGKGVAVIDAHGKWGGG